MVTIHLLSNLFMHLNTPCTWMNLQFVLLFSQKPAAETDIRKKKNTSPVKVKNCQEMTWWKSYLTEGFCPVFVQKNPATLTHKPPGPGQWRAVGWKANPNPYQAKCFQNNKSAVGFRNRSQIQS